MKDIVISPPPLARCSLSAHMPEHTPFLTHIEYQYPITNTSKCISLRILAGVLLPSLLCSMDIVISRSPPPPDILFQHTCHSIRIFRPISNNQYLIHQSVLPEDSGGGFHWAMDIVISRPPPNIFLPILSTCPTGQHSLKLPLIILLYFRYKTSSGLTNLCLFQMLYLDHIGAPDMQSGSGQCDHTEQRAGKMQPILFCRWGP